MKQKIIMTAVLTATLVSATPSYALSVVGCMPSVCLHTDQDPENNVSNCTSYTDKCYNGVKIRSCDTCNSGYTRTQQSATVSECDNEIEFYNCVSNGGSSGGGDDCDGTCSDCTSTSWTTVSTGYQRQTTAICNKLTCVCTKGVEFRCAAGYYGDPPKIQQIGNYTGCTRCPSSDGANGTSIAGLNTIITNCYIRTGTSFNDSTGSGTYTSNCNYTE